MASAAMGAACGLSGLRWLKLNVEIPDSSWTIDWLQASSAKLAPTWAAASLIAYRKNSVLRITPALKV